jgi:hypothetical protein
VSQQRLLYRDRDGVRRALVFDDERPADVSVHTSQDVEPVLDGIARDRELMPHGENKLAARLPMIVVEDLIKRGIYDDESAFKKWLNGPEAEPWRIWKGRL